VNELIAIYEDYFPKYYVDGVFKFIKNGFIMIDGDFGASITDSCDIIFFLTSHFIDSIHSTSCNN